MSLYQCDKCGCMENTALGAQYSEWSSEFFDWTGLEEWRLKKLCSVCGPKKYKGNTPTEYGTWHGWFKRVFLPKGMFKTNREGNLEHIETGETDVSKYQLEKEDGTD